MPFITRLNCHRRGVGERPEEENGRETLVHPTRPAKGDEKLLEISTRRATFPSPSLPLIFFPALHLINLASRSLCIGDFLRRGERGKKKHFKQGAPKWHRADKLRYRLDEAPTARVPIYIYICTTRGDVDLWTVSIIDPPIYYSLVFVGSRRFLDL